MKIADLIQESNRKVKLTDLYDQYELNDETELLYLRLEDLGYYEIIKFPFTVRTMTVEQAKRVMKDDLQTVIQSFKWAGRDQRAIVRDKMKNFDDARIVVLENGHMVDGNHHLVAAVRAKKPISYIDLAEFLS